MKHESRFWVFRLLLLAPKQIFFLVTNFSSPLPFVYFFLSILSHVAYRVCEIKSAKENFSTQGSGDNK
jgi:L-asparagine transporter-like permease